MKKILLLVFAFATSFAIAQTSYTSQTGGNCDGTWGDSDCWSPSGVPGSSDTATVGTAITVSSNSSVEKLVVTSDGDVTLNATLTIANSAGQSSNSGFITCNADFTISDGNFTNGTGAYLIVGAGVDVVFSSGNDDTLTNNGTVQLGSTSTTYSALLFDGTTAGSGVYQYQLYLPAATGAWELAGSPFPGQSVTQFMTLNPANLATSGSERGIGPYSNTDHSFTTWTSAEASGQTLTAGKGFQMASASGSTVTFQRGSMQTSNVTISIDSKETDPFSDSGGTRYNLLSNPFPAYIALNNAADGTNNWLATNIGVLNSDAAQQVVWAWNGTSYDTFTHSDGAKYLAPGQGFFVGAAGVGGASGTVSFTTAMRKQNNNPNGFMTDSMDDFRGELFIDISQSDFSAYTKIFFIENMTDQIDPGYDGSGFGLNSYPTIYSKSVDSNFYTSESGEPINLASQSLAYSEMWDKVIPLGINALGGEEMTIGISHRTTPADLNIYLEDTEEGTMTNLLDGDFVYTPTSDLSGVGRFFIHMSADTMSNEEVSTSMLNAYKEIDASYITIEGLATQTNETNVSLYNILGREVLSTTLNNNMGTQTISTVGLSAGIYVIELESGTDRLTKKLLIQ